MTHDDELIDRLVMQAYEIAQARNVNGTSIDAKVFKVRHADVWKRTREDAIAFLATVRAYDAERRASVLDVAALKTFDPASPGTLVWLPDGMPSIPTHDPDDYRDLPVAMTEPVRFKGGLTEGKS